MYNGCHEHVSIPGAVTFLCSCGWVQKYSHSAMHSITTCLPEEDTIVTTTPLIVAQYTFAVMSEHISVFTDSDYQFAHDSSVTGLSKAIKK